ncbi:MAG: zinc ABC transporter substrate-binding protein, partial [Bifidobacteriaceae bacterium]|nr:zinc ABC transporter substrate-binding protein [Bifidobacteriaceae bacterium]
MEKRASLNLSLFALIPTIFITFLVLVLGLSGCANKQNSSSTLNNVNTASCPSQPINVLASINQWGSLVKQIGGVCVNVTSIISSTNIEAHNYEPTANNIIEFNNNQLIVINGAGYDDWA